MFRSSENSHWPYGWYEVAEHRVIKHGFTQRELLQ